jgi:hypothetical protein
MVDLFAGIPVNDDAAAPANGVRKAVYRDPDGNDIGFGGVPR